MADILINYGKNPYDMTYELLERAQIYKRIASAMSVFIKPNLVLAAKADGGATTHPEIVEGIIAYLQNYGINDITIAEGAWVGEGKSTSHAFDLCGYTALSKKYGVKILDTKRDTVIKRSVNGEKYSLCESIASCDYLINVPVLKAHCQTRLTCCMKNLKGCIPDSEKRRFHSMGLHRPIAELNAILKPDLHVIDSICGDLTFEEGGNPVQSDRILLGTDALLLDSYCAALIGLHPDEVGYLEYARKMGLGKYAYDTTVIEEMNAGKRPQHRLVASRMARRLSANIEENSACSACYAALIFALNNTRVPRDTKIKIGQGYRGKKCGGIGVGNCTAGCNRFVKGCPPTALDIIEMLESL